MTLKTPVPFLQWPGGKRAIEREILERMPARIEAYAEPFLGAGAVFFALYRARRFADNAQVRLADVDPDLINIWIQVRDKPEELIRRVDDWVGQLQGAESHEDARALYHAIRNKDGDGFKARTAIERAAKFMVLNLFAMNGVWRKNLSGAFNVSICDDKKRRKRRFDAENLRHASEALQGVEIVCGSYETTLQGMPAGAVAYLDPPYAPTKPGSFTSYGSGRFTLDAQRAVAAEIGRMLWTFGVVVASNADTVLTRELYTPGVDEAVMVKRSVNSKGSGRAPVPELLIRRTPVHYFAGIDNSANHCAIVVTDDDGDVVFQRQVITHRTRTRHGAEVLPPNAARRPMQRLAWLADFYRRALDAFDALQGRDPFLVWCAVEGYGFASQRGHTAAEAGGILRAELVRANWSVSEIPPPTLKLFATGRGAVRGVNKVSKEDVRAGAKARFGWTFANVSGWDDLTDARVLAELARQDRALRTGLVEADVLTEEQRTFWLGGRRDGRRVKGHSVRWHRVGHAGAWPAISGS